MEQEITHYMYKGIIIEESLHDGSVLQDVAVIETSVETVTEKHQTPWLKQWTLHTIEVADAEVDRVAQKLASSLISEPSSWYVDVKNESTHIIIFPQKVFRVDRSRPSEYEKVTSYGLSLGIPAHQLDFSTDIK